MSQCPENPDDSPAPAAGRAEILVAARDLFGETGYDGVSMSAIAQRAGTSKANVFHHFRSKDALYVEVMREACAQASRIAEPLADDGEDLDARLREFLRRQLEAMHSDPDRSHLIMREILESSPSRGEALASQVFGGHFAEVVALFEEGRARGEFARDVPPALAAHMALACNTVLFQSQHVLRHLPGIDFLDDPERYAALVGRVLLDGLRHEGHDAGPEGSNE